MPKSIWSPVGAGCENKHADVATVQYLLNCTPRHVGGPRSELIVDGVAGKRTMASIARFERAQLGTASGCVTPGGETLRRLQWFDPYPREPLPLETGNAITKVPWGRLAAARVVVQGSVEAVARAWSAGERREWARVMDEAARAAAEQTVLAMRDGEVRDGVVRKALAAARTAAAVTAAQQGMRVARTGGQWLEDISGFGEAARRIFATAERTACEAARHEEWFEPAKLPPAMVAVLTGGTIAFDASGAMAAGAAANALREVFARRECAPGAGARTGARFISRGGRTMPCGHAGTTAFVREVVRPAGPDRVPKLARRALPFALRYAPSPIHRWGIFAAEEIPARRRVCEYAGERIDAREVARRALRPGVYHFWLNERCAVDGAVRGSGAEFINHSCEPNLEARISKGRIWLVSLRRIRMGEELSFDYGAAGARMLPCQCGAKSCHGFLNPIAIER